MKVDHAYRNDTPQRSRLSPWQIAGIAVIAAIFGAALALLFHDTREPPTRPVEVNPGDHARAIIAHLKEEGSQPDLDELFERAEQFGSEGQLTDAHLLLFYAARSGHMASARELGAMYDPVHHSSKTSIMDEPDYTQALKWYKQAAEAGDPEANARLEQLKLWMERAAAEGDEDAKRLLLQWNQR